MSNSLIETSDIFSIFHDGTPENWTMKNNNLTVRVSCLYLAEQFSPKFEYFHLKIEDIIVFKFVPWILESDSIEITDLREINKCDFEISSAKIENNLVKIVCHEHSGLFDSPGGDFILNSKSISVFDEEGQSIRLDKLKQISKEYWNRFRNKS